MILAAGLGTRLRPLTELLPKPMMPVVGVPNIVRVIEQLKRHGIVEVAINLFHHGEVIERALGDGSQHGVSITYLREHSLLGTGGGIKNALSVLGERTFVVINGDILFAPDLTRALAAHRRTGALATLVVRSDPEAERYGAIGLDHGRQIRRLVWEGDRSATINTYMFTGVHILEPEIGEFLPDEGCIVRRTYIPLLQRDERLFGCPDGGLFRDIGTPAQFLQTNLDLVLGRESLRGYDAPDEGLYVGRDVIVGRGCVLHPGAIIGDGAQLAPGIQVCRTVVLPGARVVEDVTEGIVSPYGCIIYPFRSETSV